MSKSLLGNGVPGPVLFEKCASIRSRQLKAALAQVRARLASLIGMGPPIGAARAVVVIPALTVSFGRSHVTVLRPCVASLSRCRAAMVIFPTILSAWLCYA